MQHILDHPVAYHLWQAPFIAQKVAPFRRHNPGLPFRRVLDVGCGPGTNRELFAKHAYVGIDLDPDYVGRSRARAGGAVLVGDASMLPFRAGPLFDCIFVNSLLHHLDDGQVAALLTRASSMLAPGGRIHVIDLVVPAQRSLARSLALRDRGRHPRSAAHLRRVIANQLLIDADETFALRLGPVPCWQMIYLRGTPREAPCE